MTEEDDYTVPVPTKTVGTGGFSSWYIDCLMAKRRKAFRRAAMRLSTAARLLRQTLNEMSIARMILRIIRCQTYRLAAESIGSSNDSAER